MPNVSRQQRWESRSVARAGLLAAVMGVALTAWAPGLRAQTAAAVGASLSSLEGRSGAPLEVTRSPVTDLPIHIRTRPGRPIAIAVAASASAEVRAAAALEVVAPALGLGSAKDLEPSDVPQADAIGMDHARYRQVHRGVPVAAGDVVVHLRGAGVTSATGHVLPGIALDTTPAIDAEQARAIAVARVRKTASDGAGAGATLSAPRLEILNVGFFERRALTESRLAWFTEARGEALRERLWIDAIDGRVLLQFSQLTDARNRRTYTAANTATLPGTLVRVEGQGPTGDVDVDRAHDYAGDTYDYFASQHGRDSYDGAGATLISTAHYCEGTCPYANAFWDGTQMAYGEGFSAADDVVGHELTHAVTEYTAGLVYCLQSGALNESFSDIFGETIDLTNTGGTDTPAVRWLMGEDVPGIGALRDMRNPPAYDQPGKVTDPQYLCATSCADWDNGGVHINSGVPNHAFALMADGGTYNSVTVTGIGLTKAGKIQYRALAVYLTANATLLDAYAAVNQSCQDLVGSAGITAADCAQVTAALQAVQMNVPVCVPSVCSNGAVEGAEACDDGNTDNCDGCDANCTVTGCGNGITACGEACDDGNLTGGDGCEADCTLTPGCGIFTANDLPQSIPDLGAVVSTIAVPLSGRVTDVNVVGLRGTHTYLGDLRFDLTSPAATTTTIVNRVCGNLDDFALGLDDEAGAPILCPATDGAAHVPANPLAAFDGQSASGTWTLTVSDLAAADVGQLDAWGLVVCADPCGNGAPDPGEECDDGNADDGDGCTSQCTLCGNGTTSPPEGCDDGNLVSGDGCDANCTATGCGNGIVTPPEACDDGNANDTDACRNDCTVYVSPTPTDTPTPQPPGDCCTEQSGPSCADSACAACVCGLDGFCCTTLWDAQCVAEAGDECAASCGCGPTPTPTPPPPPGCAATPVAGCATPGKAALAIKDRPPGGPSDGDGLTWKWIKGPALSPADFGDPVGGNTGFRLCVYDSSGLVSELTVSGGGLCDGAPCWKRAGSSGYKYRDGAAASDGLATMLTKGGTAGRSKILFKGKDASLPSLGLPLDTSTGVSVQLFRDDASTPCWQATFPSAITSDATSFKAKIP